MAPRPVQSRRRPRLGMRSGRRRLFRWPGFAAMVRPPAAHARSAAHGGGTRGHVCVDPDRVAAASIAPIAHQVVAEDLVARVRGAANGRGPEPKATTVVRPPGPWEALLH